MSDVAHGPLVLFITEYSILVMISYSGYNIIVDMSIVLNGPCNGYVYIVSGSTSRVFYYA